MEDHTREDDEASDEWSPQEQPQGLQEPVLAEDPETKLLTDLIGQRFQLTLWLVVIATTFTAVTLLVLLFGSSERWERIALPAQAFITPFHTLLGVAVGYYFADRHHR